MPFPRDKLKEWGREKGWKCERCGRLWKDGWILEFHHKIPASLGGTDEKSNCILLCLGCHHGAHKAIEIGGRISAQLIQTRLTKTQGRWK